MWSAEPDNTQIKRGRANILRSDPGGSLTASSQSIQSMLDCWQLFFTDDAIEKYILKHTNEHRKQRIQATNLKIDAALQNHIPIDCKCADEKKCRCFCHKTRAEFVPVTLKLIKAFIGLLYMKGVKILF